MRAFQLLKHTFMELFWVHQNSLEKKDVVYHIFSFDNLSYKEKEQICLNLQQSENATQRSRICSRIKHLYVQTNVATVILKLLL